MKKNFVLRLFALLVLTVSFATPVFASENQPYVIVTDDFVCKYYDGSAIEIHPSNINILAGWISPTGLNDFTLSLHNSSGQPMTVSVTYTVHFLSGGSFARSLPTVVLTGANITETWRFHYVHWRHVNFEINAMTTTGPINLRPSMDNPRIVGIR
ncbi:MAG: hypothetical protein FWC16_01025 [Defluviitaleaceae bacterium]|nr:hypothetical protein [Defluviitaleaceae bacterium]MCL2273487.1 hypothetical protein [Defluviitaleaceae bacterium]